MIDRHTYYELHSKTRQPCLDGHSWRVIGGFNLRGCHTPITHEMAVTMLGESTRQMVEANPQLGTVNPDWVPQAFNGEPQGDPSIWRAGRMLICAPCKTALFITEDDPDYEAILAAAPQPKANLRADLEIDRIVTQAWGS